MLLPQHVVTNMLQVPLRRTICDIMPEFHFAEVWGHVSLLSLLDFRVMSSLDMKIHHGRHRIQYVVLVYNKYYPQYSL